MNTEREQLLDEIVTAYLKAAEAGQAPSREELIARHPELANDLAAFLAAESQMNRLAAPLHNSPVAPRCRAVPAIGRSPSIRISMRRRALASHPGPAA